MLYHIYIVREKTSLASSRLTWWGTQVLLSRRACPNAQNARGESPLLLCVRLGDAQRLKVMRKLMKANADSNLGDAQDGSSHEYPPEDSARI